MAEPYFSICIPTCDRAELLAESLISLERQSFTDFEIVISDNASGKATANVVDRHNDRRIRYFRNASQIPAGANWDLALRQARGRLLVLLADDDVLMPDALEVVRQSQEAGSWEIIMGGFMKYFRLSPGKGRLVPRPFSGKLLPVEPRSLVENSMAYWGVGTARRPLPAGHPEEHSSATFFHRDAIRKTLQETGRLVYVDAIGDLGLIAVALRCNRVTYLDHPLALVGFRQGDCETGRLLLPIYHHRSRFTQFRKFMESRSPLRAVTFANMGYASITELVERNVAYFPGQTPIPNNNYLIAHAIELLNEPNTGWEAFSELQEWIKGLGKIERSRQRAVLTGLCRNVCRAWIWNVLLSAPPLFRLARTVKYLLRGQLPPARPKALGYDARDTFPDINSAAMYVQEQLAPNLVAQTYCDGKQCVS